MLSNSQIKRASEAYNEALKSSCYHKHGCVITCSGKIIGRGFNNYRTTSSDKIINKCMACHAEAAAIRDVVKKYKWNTLIRRETNNINYLSGRNCTIYVVRVGITGITKRSDPCHNCTKLIRKFGIKRIVYSNDQGGYEMVQASKYNATHSSSGFKKIYTLLG